MKLAEDIAETCWQMYVLRVLHFPCIFMFRVLHAHRASFAHRYWFVGNHTQVCSAADWNRTRARKANEDGLDNDRHTGVHPPPGGDGIVLVHAPDYWGSEV
jgi:hypothetical protein